MKNKNKVVLGKDLFYFVGYNSEEEQLKVVPFTFNEEKNKITDLIDNEICEKPENSTMIYARNFFEEKYNVKLAVVWSSKDNLYSDKEKMDYNKITHTAKTIYNSYAKEQVEEL